LNSCEDTIHTASKAAGFGTINTLSARHVALFARTILSVSIHTGCTDGALSFASADSAVSNFTTLTFVSLPEGSWGTDLALTSFFTEVAASSAWLTGTGIVSVELWHTSSTLVHIGLTNSEDLSNLTVVDINGITTDLGAGRSVLGKGEISFATETLGGGTDTTFGMMT
jgi:hypothetical protein